MKKVLIITYYWPPSGGSGVQRWMYFSKYLSEFGFSPIVLTVNEKKASYKSFDESFVEYVKHVKVYKTNTFEPLKLYSYLTTGSVKQGIPAGNIKSENEGVFYRLAAYIRGNLFIPDARVGWNTFAIKQARKIVTSEAIDVVITTGPPHSSHLIGLKLKKEYDINWVADLRDPWTDIFYNSLLKRGNLAQSKDKKLELEVLTKADRVLTVGIKLKELLRNKMSSPTNKFHHIYNGYDSFLMDEIEGDIHKHFEITFIGLLTPNQPYKTIIKAIQSFLKKVPDADVKICLAGNIQDDILEEFIEEFSSHRINNKGYVPHRQAIKLMKSSQLLINILAEMKDSQILISGKQMEYLATGNPVLCVGNPNGESALIVEDIENAKVFAKDQLDNCTKFISEAYDKWKNDKTSANSNVSEFVKKNSRYETTRQLADFLKTI